MNGRFGLPARPIAISRRIASFLASQRVTGLSAKARYLLGIAVVLLVTALRFALFDSLLSPFVIYYLGVALVSLICGLGPGLLSLLLSAVLANWLFVVPYRQFSWHSPAVVSTLLYLGSAGSIAVLLAFLRSALLDAHRMATRLRQSQEELAKSDAKARAHAAELETVLEAVPAAVFITHDSETSYVEGNRLAYEITGTPPGTNLKDVVQGPSRRYTKEGAALPSAELALNIAARGVEIPFHSFDAIWLDGTVRHVFGSAKPLFDAAGKPCGAVSACLDVTPLELARRTAKENERQFRALADSMPQIVWAARPDGFVDYYNRKWHELAGTAPGNGGEESWLPMIHPDDRQRALDFWQESIRTGQPLQIELRLRFSGQGEGRWYLNRALPVRDEEGAITRWYGTCTDMHDLKLAEQSLRETARRKTEFLAMLSHELRNPLAPIRNCIYLLGRADPGSEQARRALAIIYRQSQHLVRLVDDLLDMTRIERGRIRLQRERIDLRALLAEIAEDHRVLFQNAGVRFDLDLGKKELPVYADRARLAQVVGNLLQNAAKFTSKGGSAQLRLAQADEKTATISVSDSGAGIPAEVMANLFEPFVQADKTLHRTLGGLGLGLALVKGLLELHGGTVRAESAGAGKGATFTITLPLEHRAAGSDALSPEGELNAFARRVLVIEDNPDAAQTVKDLLEMGQHQVEVAYSGAEGLARAHAFKPDVVICDIGLPGLSGFEVARAMRADPALAAVGLIALTGYAQPQDVDQARAAGFDLHVAKPLPPELLERSLQEAASANRPMAKVGDSHEGRLVRLH